MIIVLIVTILAYLSITVIAEMIGIGAVCVVADGFLTAVFTYVVFVSISVFAKGQGAVSTCVVTLMVFIKVITQI
jgi:hypothetical protein